MSCEVNSEFSSFLDETGLIWMKDERNCLWFVGWSFADDFKPVLMSEKGLYTARAGSLLKE